MEHFSNPRNIGEIEDADGVGEVGNPVCGDMMSFYIKVKNDRIADNCAHAMKDSNQYNADRAKDLKDRKYLHTETIDGKMAVVGYVPEDTEALETIRGSNAVLLPGTYVNRNGQKTRKLIFNEQGYNKDWCGISEDHPNYANTPDRLLHAQDDAKNADEWQDLLTATLPGKFYEEGKKPEQRYNNTL